jgi:hypothetical protein
VRPAARACVPQRDSRCPCHTGNEANVSRHASELPVTDSLPPPARRLPLTAGCAALSTAGGLAWAGAQGSRAGAETCRIRPAGDWGRRARGVRRVSGRSSSVSKGLSDSRNDPSGRSAWPPSTHRGNSRAHACSSWPACARSIGLDGRRGPRRRTGLSRRSRRRRSEHAIGAGAVAFTAGSRSTRSPPGAPCAHVLSEYKGVDPRRPGAPNMCERAKNRSPCDVVSARKAGLALARILCARSRD